MVDPSEQRKEAPLLSGAQTVKSIRDTGYKGTDYALAELIDNSFQWGDATTVLLVLVQRTLKVRQRTSKRIDEIWVIDDGHGMSDEALNLALSFGGSGKYDDRSGIGRFGMGLPQASVSQCKRTDIWTWQTSQPENASHTYLDLDELEGVARKANLTVPWPTHPAEEGYVELPEWIRDIYAGNAVPNTEMGQPLYSGTAIRWTNLDKVRWVRADAMLTHFEYLLGRIYRNFLTATRTSKRDIKVAIVDGDAPSPEGLLEFQDVRPNDPLYLMKPCDTTLEYWETEEAEGEATKPRITDEPPFDEQSQSRTFKIRRPDGQGTSEVQARVSLAKVEARPGRNPGSSTHQGLHARDNAGVSVMRAERELVLEPTLAQDATDRWWGIEVSFDPCLDEVFGVTNNKQDAPTFALALRLAREHRLTREEALEQGLFDEDHPLAELYNMAHDLVNIALILKDEGKKKKDAAAKNKKAQPSVTGLASSAKKNRADVSPTPGETEFQQANPDPDQAAETIDKYLEDQDLSPDDRKTIVANYRQGATVQVIERSIKQAQAFFWPDEALNLEIITINNAHPAYKNLIAPLRLSNEDIQAMSEEQAKSMLALSADALTWMLVAWCRYENEYRSSPREGVIQEVRDSWGRRLKEYVEDPAFKEAVRYDTEDESADGEDHA